MIDTAFLARLDDVHRRLKEHEGVLTVWMKELKKLHGGKRLGELIRDSIEHHLAAREIGFVGDTLPNNKDASVRLYLKGTRVARIIEAVQLKGAAGDRELRELANSSRPITTQELVHKLKQILTQYDLS